MHPSTIASLKINFKFNLDLILKGFSHKVEILQFIDYFPKSYLFKLPGSVHLVIV